MSGLSTTKGAACGPGDVLTAWRALGAETPEERLAIVQLLGFELTTVVQKQAEVAPKLQPNLEPSPKPSPPVVEAKPMAAPSPAPVSDANLALIPMSTKPGGDWPALPAPLADTAPQAFRVLDQLVPGRWARAWHALLGRTTSERGELDVKALVRTIALGRPIVRLPRLSRPATPRRLKLYIETQAHMAWLGDSAQALVDELARVYGARVDAEWLDDEVPGLEPDSYKTRHIVVGTFGARVGWSRLDRARSRAWLKFVGDAQRAGGDVVALCPNELGRAREIFGQSAALVVWNEDASPSQVASAIRNLEQA